MTENQKTKKREQLKAVARFSGIGFQMLGIIGLGTWIGIQLDGEDAEFKIYTLIFSLVSTCIALYLVIREVTSSSK